MIQNATNGRPTDPVIIGYAGKMSAAAKSTGESLDPAKGVSSYSVADFGRLPFAPLHAATAGLASSAMGMQDASRCNFSTLVSKVTAAAKCPDKHSKAAMNATTTDLIVHVAALAHLLFKEMGARPDAFQTEDGMFASDEEKASAFTNERFFITYQDTRPCRKSPLLLLLLRRSTPSARADRQEPLPMFRCPGSPGFS